MGPELFSPHWVRPFKRGFQLPSLGAFGLETGPYLPGMELPEKRAYCLHCCFAAFNGITPGTGKPEVTRYAMDTQHAASVLQNSGQTVT